VKYFFPLVLLLLGGCPKITQPTKHDALSNVTGMEGWQRTPQSISQEWKDWYRARVAWRRGFRETRVQRVRTVRLAELIERYPEGPAIEEVRLVLQSQSTHLPGQDDVAPPPGPSPLPPDPGQDIRPRRRPGPASRDHGREPPSWAKVPVERLDAEGQAIDEEGTQEMERVFKNRKKKKKRKRKRK
jgi:hypothetical protein